MSQQELEQELKKYIATVIGKSPSFKKFINTGILFEKYRFTRVEGNDDNIMEGVLYDIAKELNNLNV